MAIGKHRQVHLVGSIPLASSSEVFNTVSKHLGALVKRMPDGETGKRSLWIFGQTDWLRTTPNLAHSRDIPNANGIPMPVFRIRDRSQPVAFGPAGFAAAAQSSYAGFARLKRAGTIDASTRFMVALATPIALVTAFIEPEDQEAVLREYQKTIEAELKEILDTIPHAELAIQWDVCVEILILEGIRRSPFGLSKADLLERVVHLTNLVPATVEVGHHLCYGDLGHKHSVEPANLRLCVEISRFIFAHAARSIQWLHLPVPRSRKDDAYFAPIQELALPAGTELYLGLVHLTDGETGTRERMAVAEKYVSGFGIATECGFGRRPPQTVPGLLDIHAKAAAIQ